MAKSSAPVSRGAPQGRPLGRYLVFGEIASGGTATVHIGRRRGPAGTGQMVAIKRLHTHLASDPHFTTMLQAEARLTERVRHPNVIPLVEVLDAGGGELLLVMDYVHGETLGSLLGIARRRGRAIAPSICVAIMTDMLLGLHAAHEAETETGTPLALVHGDVSPQNIIVGADGKARLLDFGIAKATSPAPEPSPEGESPRPVDGPASAALVATGRRMMGTPAYMAPERWSEQAGDRRSDLFSAGVVFWEMLALDRLFRTEGDPQSPTRPARPIPPPSKLNPAVPEALDAVVLRALQARPEDRWASALDFMKAAADACTPASVGEVAAWLSSLCGQRLRERAADLARIEAVASAEYLATEIADEEPTVVETDLAARLARLAERDSLLQPISPAWSSARLRRAPAGGADPMLPDRPEAAAPSGRRDPIDDSPTSCPTLIRTPSRTLPLPLAAPAPQESLSPPTPLRAASASAQLRALSRGLDVLPTPNVPERPPRLVARRRDPDRLEADELLDRVHRSPRRPYGHLSEAVDRPSVRARGKLLVILASLPSAALVMVLLDRARPEPTRAEAAAPLIAVERPLRAAPPRNPVVAPLAAAPTSPDVTSAALAAPALVEPGPTAPEVEPAPIPPAPAAPQPALVAQLHAMPAPPANEAAPAIAEHDRDRPVAELSRPERRAPRARLTAGRSARPSDGAGIVGQLHRRALAAHQDLDPDTALALLQQALRRCNIGCGSQPRLLALTHLYLGVVLAGGFRQPDLAARHFRIAHTLQPSLAPAGHLLSPEVRAALRTSGAGLPRR